MDPLIGEIRMFAGDFAPVGWAICDGTLLQISDNEVLFALIGTTYGGDGSRTFGVPNMSGRAFVNVGAGPGLNPVPIGQMGGSETTTLVGRNIPPHTHPLSAVNTPATTATPAADKMLAVAAANAYVPNVADKDTKALPTTSAMNALSVTASTGGGKPVSIVQPYVVLNYIIATAGIMPSLNN